MANRWGNNGNSDRCYFGETPKSLQMVTAAMKLKDAPWKKSYDQPRTHIKKQKLQLQRTTLPSSEQGGLDLSLGGLALFYICSLHVGSASALEMVTAAYICYSCILRVLFTPYDPVSHYFNPPLELMILYIKFSLFKL